MVTIELEFQTHNWTSICVRETDTEDARELWLPVSQIKLGQELNEYGRGEIIQVEMPQWLAEDRRLV